MHKYRTHSCNELTLEQVGNIVKLSGWVHRKRDHGGLVFIDMRDHYGITQLVFNEKNLIEYGSKIKNETVITIEGKVVPRSETAMNRDIATGEIEVVVSTCITESEADVLPFPINIESECLEEIRLKYRFLDLRRDKLHNNILLRSKVIHEIRNQMVQRGFLEFNTPILTSSSPEGARDFLVPSRMHQGKFYALPQAPQQFKQLLMVSGFDKYFQIAPCFRDEDSRADRSPGEFYQLDVEMSFVTQEDVFNTIEPVFYNIFKKFSDYSVTNLPFPRITYDDAMLMYGTDKPDLRNPIKMSDVTNIFIDSGFAIFENQIKKGAVVRAIPAPNSLIKARSFFDKTVEYAMQEGAQGLAYLQFTQEGTVKGPLAKFLNEDKTQQLKKTANLQKGDAVFFVCDFSDNVSKLSSKLRIKIGEELGITKSNCYEFCWVVDFPFFELDKKTGKMEFSHNPFSMPQGGMDALLSATTQEDLLKIRAYQYDIVCNGIELSSGAIRNHKPDLIYKAFELVGYSKEEVDKRFSAIITAFKYGAPPHGGVAPGIDRIIMLLANVPNIREVIAFPMNQQAEDLLMQAPNYVDHLHLKELGIKVSSTKSESGNKSSNN